MGLHIHDEAEQQLVCPNGHEERVAQLYYELGGWFFVNEDEAFCSVCGAEMEDSEDQSQVMTAEDIAYERAQHSIEWEERHGGGL